MKISEIIISNEKKTIEILKDDEAIFLYSYYENIQQYTNDFTIPVDKLYTQHVKTQALYLLDSEFSFLLDIFNDNSQIVAMYKELLDYFS